MLEQFINHYGYLAILIGTFLEGETILILAGIAAKLGYLELEWVIICAFIGTLLGDQLFFFLGRYRGVAYLQRHASWQARVNKVSAVLHRHRILIILGFRFLYGLRTVTPFVIGMSRVPVIEFIILNVIGAASWALVIGLLGYAFGHGLELVLGDIKHYEMAIMSVILGASILFWLIVYLRGKASDKPAK
jgi:membrane protein DedA with SNARE-associated domain